MKVKILFKDQMALDEARDNLNTKDYKVVYDALRKYVRYGEEVILEVDTETGTVQLMTTPKSEWT